MSRFARLVFLLLIAILGLSRAQVTILRHVTVIDGEGGPPQRDVALVLEGKRIRSVTAAAIEPPKDATVIGLSGKFIMPEITNSHGHLGLLKGTRVSAGNYSKGNVDLWFRPTSGEHHALQMPILPCAALPFRKMVAIETSRLTRVGVFSSIALTYRPTGRFAANRGQLH
jgi:hypothetical protein